MPPKKRNPDSKTNSQAKRKKRKNDDMDDFDEDSGGEMDNNTNNGTETDETYDVVSSPSLLLHLVYALTVTLSYGELCVILCYNHHRISVLMKIR